MGSQKRQLVDEQDLAALEPFVHEFRAVSRAGLPFGVSATFRVITTSGSSPSAIPFDRPPIVRLDPRITAWVVVVQQLLERQCLTCVLLAQVLLERRIRLS